MLGVCGKTEHRIGMAQSRLKTTVACARLALGLAICISTLYAAALLGLPCAVVPVLLVLRRRQLGIILHACVPNIHKNASRGSSDGLFLSEECCACGCPLVVKHKMEWVRSWKRASEIKDVSVDELRSIQSSQDDLLVYHEFGCSRLTWSLPRQTRLTKHGLFAHMDHAQIFPLPNVRATGPPTRRIHFCAARPCRHIEDGRSEPPFLHCVLVGSASNSVNVDLDNIIYPPPLPAPTSAPAALPMEVRDAGTGCAAPAAVVEPVSAAPCSGADASVASNPEAVHPTEGEAPEVVAPPVVGALAAAAAENARSRAWMLQYAQEIATARQWVGTGAFLICCLAFSVRFSMLYAGEVMDVLDACPECLRPPDARTVSHIVVLPCTLRGNPDRESTGLSLPESLLSMTNMNHWVAAYRVPAAAPAATGHDDCCGAVCRSWGYRVCASHYIAACACRGLLPFPTVSQGDCALDVMCSLLGLPRNHQSMEAVRAQLQTYLESNADDTDLCAALQRYDALANPPAIVLDEPEVPAAPAAIAVAPAVSPVAAPVTVDVEANSGAAAALAVIEHAEANIDAAVIAAAASGPKATTGKAAAVGTSSRGEDSNAFSKALDWHCRNFVMSAYERKYIIDKLTPEEKRQLVSQHDQQERPCSGTASSAAPAALAASAAPGALVPAAREGEALVPADDARRGYDRHVVRNAAVRRHAVAKEVAAFWAWEPAHATHRKRKRDAECRLPRGLLKRYIQEEKGIDPKSRNGHAFKVFLSRALRDNKSAQELPGGRSRFRRKGLQGRPFKAPALRQRLFDWFCELRKIVLGRLPVRCLRRQAVKLRTEYIAECLRRGVEPDAPKTITNQWLRRWRLEHSVSLRRPNRRWKVPRRVFEQRMRIMWSNMIRVRVLCYLVFGYLPEVDGFDQKPFHLNEAGSALARTLEHVGMPEIKLKENVAATRHRWTANTYVTSSERRAAEIPPVECMFKGGQRILEDLQQAVPAAAPWLSVTTSDKGSYKTQDVVAFLDRCLPPVPPGPESEHEDNDDDNLPAVEPVPVAPCASEGGGGRCRGDRRWRILMCDAYKPHDHPAIDRLAWKKRYVVVKHGGGTTGQAQVNDTHNHHKLSVDYQDLEMESSLAEAEIRPQGMPPRTRRDCLHDFAAVWTNPELHVSCAGGHKHNHLTTALDGSEDHMTSSSTQRVWNDIHMSELRTLIVHDVCEDYAAGRLSWDRESLDSLIEPFPKTGYLDVIHEGMSEEGEDAENELQHWDDDAGESPNISEDELHESGGQPAPADVPLSDDAADEVQRHENELALLDRMIEQAEQSMNPRIVVQLRNARANAARKAHGTRQKNAAVAAALRRSQQDQFQERHARMVAERAAKRLDESRDKAEHRLSKLADELREEHANLRQREKDVLRAEVVAKQRRNARHAEEERRAALDASAKYFAAEMLGQGRDDGGTAAHRNARMDFLERVKRAAPGLPAEVEVNWAHFCTHFDRWGRINYKRAWGSQFRNLMLEVVVKLRENDGEAFLQFVRRRLRHLPKPEVVVPPALPAPPLAAASAPPHAAGPAPALSAAPAASSV